jgi:hypothetical protein
VLIDETTSREHAYTAASRGRHGNDVFTVAADRRSGERHAAEVRPDPLDELRSAVRRSTAQRLALDELDNGSVSQLDPLRRERDLLRSRLGHGPPDPSAQVRPLTDEYQGEQHHRDGACWRRERAQQDLDRLGPIGRRVHPARRNQIENRIALLDADIASCDAKLDDIDRQLEALAPVAANRTAWERQHGAELQRLDDLDRRIELIERLDQLGTPSPGRDATSTRGIDLGL